VVKTTTDEGEVLTDDVNKGFVGMIGPLDPVEANLGFEEVLPATLPMSGRIQVGGGGTASRSGGSE
jgi:hypothetical protein